MYKFSTSMLVLNLSNMFLSQSGEFCGGCFCCDEIGDLRDENEDLKKELQNESSKPEIIDNKNLHAKVKYLQERLKKMNEHVTEKETEIKSLHSKDLDLQVFLRF